MLQRKRSGAGLYHSASERGRERIQKTGRICKDHTSTTGSGAGGQDPDRAETAGQL